MELHPTPEPSLDSFYEGGPKSFAEAFPPACIRSHWDSTQLTKHILPEAPIAPLALDPRQATKICTSYYTTSQGDAPLRQQNEPTMLEIPQTLLSSSRFIRPHDGPVVNTIGAAAGKGAPYTYYAQSVNTESDIYRLDEPLTRCKEKRYRPTPEPADATNTLPQVSQEFGLSPYATYVNKQAGCREADDDAAWNRSGRLFFNQTRLDRVYPEARGPLACGKTAQ